ncbi:indole-3-glycerol phosphate synthase [archaeon SCG-AAA382B04]|nr:indole-3-glycerol phosphate synthase [archaeon SCG-AAA382B04]
MIEEILETKKKHTQIPNQVQKEIKYEPRSLKKVLEENKNPIIGEIKYSSPNEGQITKKPIKSLIKEMKDLSAISVLTEKNYFNGSIQNISKVRELFDGPILRKDFIFNKKQLYITKKQKADSILLITSILGEKLDNFVDLAKKLDLDPLVEIKNQKELDIALNTKTDIIGINNRDLESLEIDLSKTKKFSKKIPEEIKIISESGIRTKKDIRKLEGYCDGFLVGTALMKSNNLHKKIEELKCA